MGLEFPLNTTTEYTGLLLPVQPLRFHLKPLSCFPRWQIHGVESLEDFRMLGTVLEESGPGALPRCWTPEQVSINSL